MPLAGASRFLAIVLAVALGAAPAGAAALFRVDYTGSVALDVDNEFKSELTLLGLPRLTVKGLVSLTGPAVVTYHFMGSESGYNNVFRSGTLTPFVEATSNNFGAISTQPGVGEPILMGSVFFADGLFSASFWNGAEGDGKLVAKPGDDGFGIFLPGTANRYSTGRYTASELYFGFDDQRVRADDNHDDFIVRATISAMPSAVPEPATWAIMIAGFALIGAGLRRRRLAPALT